MKDSGIEWIGLIPEEIELINNKYLFDYVKGKNPNEINLEGVGLPYIGASDLEKNGDIHEYQNYCNEDLPLASKEDTLILWDGARAGLIGIGHDGYISSTIIKVIPRVDYINKKFWYWYLKGFQPVMNDWVGGTTIPHMNKRFINDIYFLKYPIEKQQKIANFLDQKISEIDHILEKTRESIEEYKKYKQSIITEVVTKGLNPNVEMKDSGIEWIGEIPNEWEVKRMKYSSQLNPNCKTTGLYDDSIVTFTPMECVYNGYFENKEGLYGNLNSSYTPFQNQDIIIAKVTPCFENGNIAIADNLFNGFGYGSSELFVIRCTDVFNKFIFYYLQNKNFIEEASSTMTGVAGLKRVSSYFMKNAHVTIPNIEEQHKIVDYLDKKISEIDNLIYQKETLLKDLKLYKKSLIYECVTGKRDV